jgi:Peroxidase
MVLYVVMAFALAIPLISSEPLLPTNFSLDTKRISGIMFPNIPTMNIESPSIRNGTFLGNSNEIRILENDLAKTSNDSMLEPLTTEENDSNESSPTSGLIPPPNPTTASFMRYPPTKPRIPTKIPTQKPTQMPTDLPSVSTSEIPSLEPGQLSTKLPTLRPRNTRTPKPIGRPRKIPTFSPTNDPTSEPSPLPTNHPTGVPSTKRTPSPTGRPTQISTSSSTNSLTSDPTSLPSIVPSNTPSRKPSQRPFTSPTDVPTSLSPLSDILEPSKRPNQDATQKPSLPLTSAPSHLITTQPSPEPDNLPSNPPVQLSSSLSIKNMTDFPVASPITKPSPMSSSRQPQTQSSKIPIILPTLEITQQPTSELTQSPSTSPSIRPNRMPTSIPVKSPTSATVRPTFSVTNLPTRLPTISVSNATLSDLIEAAKASIRDTIVQNRSIAANYIRLGFHDCVPNGPAGGCDGCLNLVTHRENAGLHMSLDVLDPIVAELENTKLGFSRADIWALATLVAADLSQNKTVFSDSFVPGRKNCETVGTCRRQPSNVCSREGPDRPADFPTTIFTTHELIDFMFERFGFDVNETIALMGAHTLGRALPGNSGYEGQNGWVTDRFELGKQISLFRHGIFLN